MKDCGATAGTGAMRAWLFALIYAAVITGQAVASERRHALVIGNSNYLSVDRLANPVNDARDIAKALKEIGFSSVELREDLDYQGMRTALRDFSTKSQGADVTLIFYAGHSIEVNKKNFLIPIDAKLGNVLDVDFETIPLDQIRTAASSASKLKMVVLDACRNNPFRMAGASSTRSIGRGLAIVEAGSNELIAYSAKEGTVASDGTGRRNSPFTTALLKNILEPGIEIGVMFRRIRDDVLRSTSNQQEPYTYASLSGDPMYLNRPSLQPPSTNKPPVAIAPEPPRDEAGSVWVTIKDTSSIAILQAFAQKYPGTIYAEMASARRSELASAERTAPAPTILPSSPSSADSTPENWVFLSAVRSATEPPLSQKLQGQTVQPYSVWLELPRHIESLVERVEYWFDHNTFVNPKHSIKGSKNFTAR